MQNTRIDYVIVTFLEHLEVEKNVSKLTVRNYGHYLMRFESWMAKKKVVNIKNLDGELMRKYRLYLSRLSDDKGQTLSKKTQGYHLIALRSMLKWLIVNDIEVYNPEKIELPKSESTPMRFTEGENLERFLDSPDINTPAGLRDRAILEVLFSTGLRVSELASLNCEQVNIDRGEFGVIGKGRRPRVVFLSERARGWLDKWLVTREDQWSPLFIRFGGKRPPSPLSDGEEMTLCVRRLEQIVDKYAKIAHLPIKISPHGLRHSFATDLLSNGANIRDVQEILGHKSIVTTQIYTHVTRPQLKEAHRKYHNRQTDTK
ncbi:MAG: tyrosine-type recombinase/integrase [Pseudomonadales bacterium]|jgi:integrase/recombinase XerD|nr:tyrosine-type recombinase/integrase [Pseudomonadales bacterium]